MDNSSSTIMLDCQTSEYFPSEDCILPSSEDGDFYQVDKCTNDNEQCTDNNEERTNDIKQCMNDSEHNDESMEVVEVGLDVLDDDGDEEVKNNVINDDSEDTMDAFENDMNPTLLDEESPITTISTFENFKFDISNNKFNPNQNYTTQSYDHITSNEGQHRNEVNIKTEEELVTEDSKEYIIAEEEVISGQNYNFVLDNSNGVPNYVYCVNEATGDTGDIVYQTEEKTVLQNYHDTIINDNVLVVMEEESNSDQVQLNTELTEEETLLNINEVWIEEEEIETNDGDPLDIESNSEEQINEIIAKTRKPGRRKKEKRKKPWPIQGDGAYRDIHIMKNILGVELSRIEALSTFRTELRGTRQKSNISTNRITTSSPPPGSYQCSECGKLFTRKFSLNSHLSVHFGLSNYKCPLCDKYFIQMCHLKDHIRAHGGLTPFHCTHCEKRFTRQSDLKRHNQTHLGVKYSCEICSKMFTSKHGLRYHLNSHKGLKPYVCELCGKAYTLQVSLLSHTKSHHYTATSISAPSNTSLIQKSLSTSKNPSTLKNYLILEENPTSTMSISTKNSHILTENPTSSTSFSTKNSHISTKNPTSTVSFSTKSSLILAENPSAISFHYISQESQEQSQQEVQSTEQGESESTEEVNVNYIEYHTTLSTRTEEEEEEEMMVKEENVVEEHFVDVIGEEIEI